MKLRLVGAPRRSLALAVVVLFFALGPLARRSSAQDSPRPAAKDNGRASRLDEMKQTAHSFKAVTIEGGARTPVKLAAEPLNRWSDPTRVISDGTLWAWKSAGRPVAVMTVEFYPTKWSYEFVSLSTGLVEAEGGGLRWTPRKAGVEFREIPGAPAPADGKAERLRQMRDLVKRFSAREFWDVTGQDYSLRLVSHPIDNYADAASGVVDGAIFTYVNGTNPEVLLLIEARHNDKGETIWMYAAAPLTTAAPTLRLDEKDAWTSPNKYGYLSNETYFFVEMPRKPSAGN